MVLISKFSQKYFLINKKDSTADILCKYPCLTLWDGDIKAAILIVPDDKEFNGLMKPSVTSKDQALLNFQALFDKEYEYSFVMINFCDHAIVCHILKPNRNSINTISVISSNDNILTKFGLKMKGVVKSSGDKFKVKSYHEKDIVDKDLTIVFIPKTGYNFSSAKWNYKNHFKVEVSPSSDEENSGRVFLPKGRIPRKRPPRGGKPKSSDSDSDSDSDDVKNTPRRGRQRNRKQRGSKAKRSSSSEEEEDSITLRKNAQIVDTEDTGKDNRQGIVSEKKFNYEGTSRCKLLLSIHPGVSNFIFNRFNDSELSKVMKDANQPLSKLNENKKEIYDSGECVMCMDGPPNLVLWDCGHKCLHHDCFVDRLKLCPVCREMIISTEIK